MKIYWTGYVFDAAEPLGEGECGQEVEVSIFASELLRFLDQLTERGETI